MATAPFRPRAIINKDTTKFAVISASASRPSGGGTAVSSFGNITYSGFANFTTTGPMNLFVNLMALGPDVSDGTGTFIVRVTANVNGSSSVVAAVSNPSTGVELHKLAIPTGTNLNSVSVTVNVTATAPVDGGAITASCNLYAILIDG